MGPTHHLRRSPIVKSVHWHNVLYIAMGECDRKSLIKLKAHLRVCLFFMYGFLSSQGTW